MLLHRRMNSNALLHGLGHILSVQPVRDDNIGVHQLVRELGGGETLCTLKPHEPPTELWPTPLGKCAEEDTLSLLIRYASALEAVEVAHRLPLGSVLNVSHLRVRGFSTLPSTDRLHSASSMTGMSLTITVFSTPKLRIDSIDLWFGGVFPTFLQVSLEVEYPRAKSISWLYADNI